jgi:hypothetical protein
MKNLWAGMAIVGIWLGSAFAISVGATSEIFIWSAIATIATIAIGYFASGMN